MNLQPLSDATLAIQLHVATVLPAVALGTWLIFVSRKGSNTHRRLGAIYLGLMTVTSLTAIFIQDRRPGASYFGFSWIHLLIVVTLVGIFFALRGTRTGNLRMHRNAMIAVYTGGLLIAGAFTFVPGRIMYRIFFGA